MHGDTSFVSFWQSIKSRYHHVSARKRIAIKWLISMRNMEALYSRMRGMLGFFSCPGKRPHGVKRHPCCCMSTACHACRIIAATKTCWRLYPETDLEGRGHRQAPPKTGEIGKYRPRDL
jgi:hypothetical protein